MNKTEITVKLPTRELIVKKLPLGKYAELLKRIQKLPIQLNNLSGVNKENLLPMLPAMIGESYEDIVVLFTIATDLTEEEVRKDDFGLNEAIDVFLAVYEVNDYKEIFAKLKKNFGKTQAITLQET